jgi:hydroxymethylpyrimidine pyrophosphatase-like HAD family hydrolase
MKKIVFCDYDGTIYTEDGKLDENVAAIRRWHDAGGKFVIATGRGFASAQKSGA